MSKSIAVQCPCMPFPTTSLLCIISVEAKQQTSKKDQDRSIITSQI